MCVLIVNGLELCKRGKSSEKGHLDKNNRVTCVLHRGVLYVELTGRAAVECTLTMLVESLLESEMHQDQNSCKSFFFFLFLSVFDFSKVL